MPDNYITIGEESASTIKENLKYELADCLDNIEGNGSFALFGSLQTAPNPGITIGDGGIGLPLSSNDALTIVASSHPAPFDRLFDRSTNSVRKTYELHTNTFDLANPEWIAFMDGIMRKVEEGLGLTKTGKKLSAQRPKLSLSEEGATYMPYQNSTKTPGIAGTLVVTLPSKHEGGEVVMTHDGRQKAFETSKFSAFGCSYLAFYTDVTLEVKPITSGRRLVLTYDLIQEGQEQPLTAARSNTELSKLLSIFSKWNKGVASNPDEIPWIHAYMFKDRYDEASLSLQGLKGHESQVANYLNEAAAQSDMYLCLANVDKTVSGTVVASYDQYHGWNDSSDEHHAIEEEEEKRISLVHVVDVNGSIVGEKMPFAEDLIVQEEYFVDVDPDKEEYDHNGHSQAHTTHYYHRTAAIFMPKSHRIPFLLQSYRGSHARGLEVITWLDSLRDDLAKPAESTKQIAGDIKAVCAFVVESLRGKIHGTTGIPSYSDEVMTRVLQTIIDSGDMKLFADACVVCVTSLDKPAFEFVGSAIFRSDFADFLPKLTQAVRKVSLFTERYLAILRICASGASAPECSDLRKSERFKWRSNEWIQLLNDPSVTISSAEDGRNICKILEEVGHLAAAPVLESVERHIKSEDMIIALLDELQYSKNKKEYLQSGLFNSVSTEIFSTILENFNLEMLKREMKHPNLYGPRGRPSTEVKKKALYFTMICHCLDSNLTLPLEKLGIRLCEEAERVEVGILNEDIMQILKDLIDKLTEETAATSPIMRTLFQYITNTYIRRFVGHEPEFPDWSRAQLPRCTRCNNCGAVSEFLRSSTQRELKHTVDYDIGHFSKQKYRFQERNCSFDREGSTYVFTIKKLLAPGDYKLWANRFNQAKSKFEALETRKLQMLLGECYSRVIHLSAVRRVVPTVAQNIRPAPAQSDGGVRQAASVVSGPRPVSTAVQNTEPAPAQSGNGTRQAASAHLDPQTPLLPVQNGQSRERAPKRVWSDERLQFLRNKYPDALLEATYRNFPPGTSMNMHFTSLNKHWLHNIRSIRCLDCPELKHIDAREWSGINACERHLKSPSHQAKVAARLGRTTSGARNEDSFRARNEPASNARIEATPSARNEASSSARNEASSNARIEATPSARIEASSSARNEASSNARIEATPSARNEASSSARNEASSNARIEATPSARIAASSSSRNEMARNPEWSDDRLVYLQQEYPGCWLEAKYTRGYWDATNGVFSWRLPQGTTPAYIEVHNYRTVKCLDCPEFEPVIATGASSASLLYHLSIHLENEHHKARQAARIARAASRKEVNGPSAQSSSSVNTIAPLPVDRKRRITMIDMTGDSD